MSIELWDLAFKVIQPSVEEQFAESNAKFGELFQVPWESSERRC